MAGQMKRGKLASSIGCNSETIRYYEKIGLLPEPDRTESGHRLYSSDDQKRLRFILRGRELGFSIEELRDFLGLVDTNDYTCADILTVTTKHIAMIDAKISDLTRIKSSLDETVSRCSGGDVPECPIIDDLFQ